MIFSIGSFFRLLTKRTLNDRPTSYAMNYNYNDSYDCLGWLLFRLLAKLTLRGRPSFSTLFDSYNNQG